MFARILFAGIGVIALDQHLEIVESQSILKRPIYICLLLIYMKLKNKL